MKPSLAPLLPKEDAREAALFFVQPLVESRSGSLEKVELAKGKLTAVVKNTGNVHATITAVTVQARA